MSSIDIHVAHTAAPQGSKRHVGRGILVESSTRLKPYRQAVRDATTQAMRDHRQLPMAGPIRVWLTFHFPRPRGHYRTGRNAHLLRDNAPTHPDTRSTGDVDKLTRATLDGISAKTGAGLIRDDSQVVQLLASKTYSDGPAGTVDIVVEHVTVDVADIAMPRDTRSPHAARD